MGTTWVDPTFESPFEALKDVALIDVLKCAGQWVKFTFQDAGKPDEDLFAYFEREHTEINIDADVAFSTSEPVVECRYADFDNVPKQGDGVTVVEKLGNVELTLNFEIVDRHEPDEQGGIMFALKLLSGSRSVIT